MVDKKTTVDAINERIKKNKVLDRADLLEYLSTIPTNDGEVIAANVKEWITGLDADPEYDGIVLPTGHIDAVLGDLGSYGVIQSTTILKLQEQSVLNKS